MTFDPGFTVDDLEREPTGEPGLPVSPGADEPGPALPRLLAGIFGPGPIGLEDHLAAHGHLPEPERVSQRRRGESPLIAEIARSGLRGRGGAGFPTATKLRAVAATRGRPIVVVNGAESEPASFKDRTLLQTCPHLVLDGAQLVARALESDELIVCTCETARASTEALTGALAERRALYAEPARARVQTVSARYIAGQETALVNSLNGGPALPTFTPPMVFEEGVRRRPTFVGNAETYAHIALIARHGADWFRQIGTADQPGSALVTLGGVVSAPGVYEIEHGASLRSLIDAAGGTQGNVGALLVGGYGGSWIDGRLAPGVALSDEHLAPHDATLGASVVFLLSTKACPVAETVRVTEWLANESAGQCGPCKHGLPMIAATVRAIAEGTAGAHAERRVAALAQLVHGRGACGHPDGAARFVSSALETFTAELQDHSRHGPCDGCALPSELPLPAHRHAPRSDQARREASVAWR